jgi:serine/threonine protein phosphatase 1
MSKPLNIIGDVAGQYDCLMELIKQLPEGDLIFVGDLIDRGPKPVQVVEYVKNNARCIRGNHEDMMIDYYRNQHRYDRNLWSSTNGGDVTIKEYAKYEKLLEEHLKWMESLPLFIRTKDYFISHGIWSGFSKLSRACESYNGRNENILIWNRYNLIKRDRMQIYGHNGNIFEHPETNSLCIDGQIDFKIGAYNTETKKIYTQEFKPPIPKYGPIFGWDQ